MSAAKRRVPRITARNVSDQTMNLILTSVAIERSNALEKAKRVNDHEAGPEYFWTQYAAEMEIAYDLLMSAWINQE